METRHFLFVLSAMLAQVIVAPTGVAHASCPKPNLSCVQDIPPVVVGSPSGQVGSYTVGIYTGTGFHCTSRHLYSSSEIWLAIDGDFCPTDAIGLYTADTTSNSLHCGNGACVDWPYLEEVGNPVTFHPRFGGFGSISVQIELECSFFPDECPGYEAIGCAEARSTDFDIDGDTDQSEKITLGQVLALAPQNRPIQYDFNLDGQVSAPDYRLVAIEMQTEIQQGHPTLYTCPSNNCSPTPCFKIAVTGTFVADSSAPGATTLSLSGSASSVTLAWTSPGDDTYNGQQLGVAKEFVLRGSANPITTANFDSATTLTGVPAPDLPGTAHQMTVNACTLNMKYFAFKTKDYQGNLSAMSNVVVVSPLAVTDLGATVYCTSIDVTWSAPGYGCTAGAGSTYDLRKSRSAITAANFGSASQLATGTLGSPGSQMLVNHPAGACSGRWYYAIKTSDAAGNTSPISNVIFGQTPCIQHCEDVASRPARQPEDRPVDLPLSLAVSNANPATTSLQVRCSIPGVRISEPFELAIFDASGRKVRTLQEGGARAGVTTFTWDLRADGGQPVTAGVYFMRLRLGSDVRSQPFTVLH